MEQDLATLQVISETLKEEPQATQRTLAKKANMSLGLMNAVLGRFVERGWIMLTNVNGRKLAYAVTPDGISELAERGKKFALRTFKIASDYNDILYKEISKAKTEGKRKVVLYGQSYIKFLLIYICGTIGIDFEEKCINDEKDRDSCCFIGELEDIDIHYKAIDSNCVSLIEILNGK